MEKKLKSKSKKFAMVDIDDCVACGACVKECKFDAIAIKQGMYAQVDEDRCVGCSKCAKICPASVIQMKKREESFSA